MLSAVSGPVRVRWAGLSPATRVVRIDQSLRICSCHYGCLLAWSPGTDPPTVPSPGRAERALRRGQSETGVDDERLARDPARLVAREVHGAPADVPAGALGRQRARAPPALAGVRAEILDHRRPHGPRRYRVA